MADFNQPALTSLYADMVNVLKDRDISALKWLDGTTDSNIPSGAKRWYEPNKRFEKFDGTVWSALATKYMIDVDTVDGCTVNDLGLSATDLWTASKISTALGTKLDSATYTDAGILAKIKNVDGASSGLDADLLDGLHAASTNTVSTVVARDTSGNFSAGTITANLTGTASTATTLTGLTSTVAELNFVDGVTSNIQNQLSGKLGSTATAADSAKLNGVASATTATANTIVKRDASGYIYGGAFNSTLADTATAATHYYVETGSDGWLRPKPLANVKAELLANANLTGAPSAPTAALDTYTTQVATTAFVGNAFTSYTSGLGQTIAALTAGGLDIGSYAFLARSTHSTDIVYNTNYAGSGLKLAGIGSHNVNTYGFSSVLGATVTGTWRALGSFGVYSTVYPCTLFIRVA